MAPKSLVNEVAVTATVVAVLPAVVPVVLVDDELLHATSTTAAPMLVSTDTARLGVDFMGVLLIDGQKGERSPSRKRKETSMNEA
jgi:hypothetical protein